MPCVRVDAALRPRSREHSQLCGHGDCRATALALRRHPLFRAKTQQAATTTRNRVADFGVQTRLTARQ
jgi:hypothetical protein